MALRQLDNLPCMPVGRNVLLVAVATVATLALAACSRGAQPAPTPSSPSPSAVVTPSPSATGTPTPTPVPTRPFPAGISPLTGLPVAKPGPVLAVKIDNVRPARPPTALSQADLVYVEPVEAGLSRLMAIFSSRLPAVVGPVRSARQSDLTILAAFGGPAFAYSGAQTRLLPLIGRAPLYDVSPARAGNAYARHGDRPAPHNLYADPRKLLSRAPKATPARDLGLRFGAALAGGAPKSAFTVTYKAFTVTFRWNAALKRWDVSMDGTPIRDAAGPPAAPATVVIQYAKIRPSGFKDSGGNASPYVQTVGTGRALVLRDGRAYEARWTRPTAAAGTTFRTPSGVPVPFATGQTWIVFAPA